MQVRDCTLHIMAQCIHTVLIKFIQYHMHVYAREKLHPLKKLPSEPVDFPLLPGEVAQGLFIVSQFPWAPFR